MSLEPDFLHVNNASGIDAIDWVSKSVNSIQDALKTRGRYMMRGFSSESGIADKVITTLGYELMEDVFWSTPRKRVSGKTFTATHYPSNREIKLHSEMSYSRVYPRILCFHVIKSASTGGATPIANVDEISRVLGGILEKFHKQGVRYVRNFRPKIDIPFPDAFGVASMDEAIIEAKSRGMTVEILAGERVQVVGSCGGTLTDELNSNLLWFNQSHLFHPASLRSDERESMLEIFGKSGFPRDASYGDGETISDETIHFVNKALSDHAEDVLWQNGDILIIDNLRYMHGRRSFTGERVSQVAMGAPTIGSVRRHAF